MVHFASQQRLAFPIEFRLVESLRSAAVVFACAFGQPETALPKLPPSSLRSMWLLWSATFAARATLFFLTQNCGVLLQHHVQALADIGCH